jgi:hypothetical protein
MLTSQSIEGKIWRENAKQYSKTLLKRQEELYSEFGKGDKQIIIDLVNDYQKEMV